MQDIAKFFHVRIPPEVRERELHLRDGGGDELEERGVVLHAIDEDEAPGVLELALDGHAIELVAEPLALCRPEPCARRELVEARLDERAIELLVAVIEERDQIVD